MKVKNLIKKLQGLDQELPIVGASQERLSNINIMANVSGKTKKTEAYSLRNVICEDWLRISDMSDLENEY
tara:strand:+ start:271 stop:480 length:210 start_codon:yes stop_codon:yes gene_type:complete